jgi:tetratricopeptide (TPR) repeat protein
MRRTRIVYFLLTAALIFCANLTHADDRNLLPKYGDGPKADWQKAADDAYVKATDEEYHGDRKKASTDTARRGWQLLAGGDLEGAMRRFNQAWLLNSKNGIALWGMAAVETEWEKFDESLKLFAEAENFVGSEINFSVDYSRAVAMAGIKRKDDALINDAFDRFERIYQKAPQNGRNLKNWAMALLAEGKYPEAWAKVKLAESTPGKGHLDPSFLADLQAHMPRPQD